MPSPSAPELTLQFDRPWFPGVAERLVTSALSARGLTPTGYRTHAWIDGAPVGLRATGLLEDPPPSLIERYAAMGLQFAEHPDTDGRALLEAAWTALDQVADVGSAVTALVRAIHVLTSRGVGYDVSHSDPELPCSIFLSLPVGEPHARLRTAESILHEAMHLQLTLIEAEHPIVRSTSATQFSPWQRRDRPISGIVHGLYVFAVIDAYMAEMLAQRDMPDRAANYMRKRRREIAEEISAVSQVAGHADLTVFGRTFVDGLLSRSGAAP